MAQPHSSKTIALILSLVCILTCGCTQKPGVRRFGSVIGIEKKNIAEYKRLHTHAWPDVLKQIEESNIRNYSIYLGEVKKDKFYLFSYFEYTGKNFDRDMKKMAKDKSTQKWWKHTDPLQFKLPTAKKDEWWSNWQEVFHYQGPGGFKKSQRFGSIIGLKNSPEEIIAYTQLHAAAWPGVLKAIEKANIRNFSIYMGQLKKDEYLLFSYFEYIGDDFKADMKKLAQDKVTQVWWTYTDPLQQRLAIRKKGEHWSSIEEVFHTN